MERQDEPELMDLRAEAEAYAKADFSDVNEAFVERLLELAGNRPSARALDLGTGPGDIPVRVARLRPRWRVVGVDASAPMLRFARRAVDGADLSGTVELILADAKATGLDSGSFDVIFSNSILHHINDTGALWAEIRRLAAPGATIFLRDLRRPDSQDEARRIVETYAGEESDLLQEEYYRSLLAAWTVNEIRRQLAAAGLDHLDVRKVTDRHVDVFGQV